MTWTRQIGCQDIAEESINEAVLLCWQFNSLMTVCEHSRFIRFWPRDPLEVRHPCLEHFRFILAVLSTFSGSHYSPSLHTSEYFTWLIGGLYSIADFWCRLVEV